MSRFIPALSLLLALCLTILGSILIVRGQPQVSYELHKARVQGAEQVRQELERRLKRDQRQHELLIYACFAFATILIIVGLVQAYPPKHP